MSKHISLSLVPLLLLFLQSNRSNAQSGWFLQYRYYAPLNGVAFTDANTGTVVGHYGTILHTDDGGSNWKLLSNVTTNDLFGICFTDAEIGTAVGDSGTILRSTDGGTNWIMQPSGITAKLRDVAFYNANIGTACGDYGAIIRTTNGGKDWMRKTSGAVKHLWGVWNMGTSVSIVVGDSGTILRSDDDGETWMNQTSGTQETLSAVYFSDVNTGFVFGEYTILRTTDGGTNWSKQFRPEILWRASFTDASTGTAVGGVVLRTSDGGASWIKQEVRANYMFLGVSFSDAKTGTAVGLDNGGVVYRTTTGGATWIEDQKPNPIQFHLEQNYPNPVASSTTIPFSLTRYEYVSLRVYDLLGRQVAVLVDGERTPGQHAVPFDASGEAPGLYFYKLRTGSVIEMRKMVVIKP
jgi:photosystem II stability/assembly factor-like uncharacterized protein